VTVSTLYARPERHTYLDAPLDAHHRQVVHALVTRLGLRAGDGVIEVGAGSGRYTRALLDLELRVIALEPDPKLHAKLAAAVTPDTGATVLALGIGDLRDDLPPVRALCGFHVLHHLDPPTLRTLARDIRRLESTQRGFRGWLFMEPNPWNPLYPLQILLHPGMRFREEAGIWRRDYRDIFAAEGVRYAVLGHVGSVPPVACRRLPARLGRTGGSVSALYRVVGGLSAGC
jgi:hypothetical protein